MEYSNDEEAVQSCISRLRFVLQTHEGNINLAEGSDPVFNEAVRRLKHEKFDDLLSETRDPESIDAIRKAIQMIDSKEVE
jgi:hypothetical protein